MRRAFLRPGSVHALRPFFDPGMIRKEILDSQKQGLIRRCFGSLYWHFRHLWSTRATQVSTRFVIQRQFLMNTSPSDTTLSDNDLFIPHDLGLSPSDLDLCITYLANEFKSPYYFLWSAGMLCCYLGTHVRFWVLHEPSWLCRIRGISGWAFVATYLCRPWVQMAFVKRIRDKERVANILRTAELA